MQRICIIYQLLVTWELLHNIVWTVNSPHTRYSLDFMGLCQSKTVLFQAVFFQKCLPVKHLSSLLIVILITIQSLIESPHEAITLHYRPSPQIVTGSQEVVTSDLRTRGCNFSLRFSSTEAQPHCVQGWIYRIQVLGDTTG